MLINATGSAINLDATQVVAVAAFLRVINALENIRASLELIERAAGATAESRRFTLLARAGHETEDALQVLAGGGLHPAAVASLQSAFAQLRQAQAQHKAGKRRQDIDAAIGALEQARAELIDA